VTAILERRNARNRLRRAARRRVSAGLEEWLDGDQPTTLGTLNHAFGEKILAAACLALLAPSALPIPTGGATAAFEVIALVFAGQMVLARRTVWLPRRWEARELGRAAQKALRMLIRFVTWCERISHPRLAAVVTSRAAESVLGVAVTAFVLTAALSPPFSGLETLPAIGVVLVALGILLEDAAFTIAGLAVGVAGIVVAVTVGSQAVEVLGIVGS
jgi:hypothetical protein